MSTVVGAGPDLWLNPICSLCAARYHQSNAAGLLNSKAGTFKSRATLYDDFLDDSKLFNIGLIKFGNTKKKNA